MSKKNKVSVPRQKKRGSLTYQIKRLELARKEKKNTPMLKKTEAQYKKHALKYAEWAKDAYDCKTLDDCKAHIQEYANYLIASGKTASTTHTYLASICRVFDVPLENIKKPIRVVAHNTRSRGTKAVDIRKDAGQEASPRLYDFAQIAGKITIHSPLSFRFFVNLFVDIRTFLFIHIINLLHANDYNRSSVAAVGYFCIHYNNGGSDCH